MEDCYLTGCLVRVRQVVKKNDDYVRVLVVAENRVRISEIYEEGELLRCNYTFAEDCDDDPEDINLQANVRVLKQIYTKYMDLNGQNDSGGRTMIEGIDDAALLCSLIANEIDVTFDVKQTLLDIDSVKLRVGHLIDIIGRENNILSIAKRINNRVVKNMNRGQREYYLREQLQVIKEELGEDEDADDEVRAWKDKLTELSLEEKVDTKIRKEIDKFSKMNPMSPDANVSRTYIETVLDLPWHTSSKVNNNIRRAEKILNEENSVATSIFKTYKGKSIIVNQLMGDYNGQYYPYNGAPFSYNGKRPFYVIIVADASTIDRMNADDNFAKFLRPGGLKNSYRFNQAASELNFKVVPDWKDNVGRFRQSRSEQNLLTHCEGDRETGVLCFTIAANLKPLAKDDSFLTNVANYNVQSQSGFDITIRAIKPDDVTNNNRAYLDGMTHLITVKGKFNTSRDELSMTLANQFPEWIKESSSTSDIDPNAAGFSTTTFGLERFLQGIYDAFSAGNDSYGKIVIKLED